MAKLTPIERLQEEISGILKEYGDEVSRNVDEIVQDMGKKGAKAVRAEARAKFNGRKYSGSWTFQTEKKRTGTIVTIYSKKPGLPHLLENGHAKRGGGRVDGRPHIAPVEADLTKAFEMEVKAKL